MFNQTISAVYDSQIDKSETYQREGEAVLRGRLEYADPLASTTLDRWLKDKVGEVQPLILGLAT